jgi:hypothetical protein
MFEKAKLEQFLEFSSEVTAFTVTELSGTGQADLYLKTVEEGAGIAAQEALLDTYGRLVAGTAKSPSQRRKLLPGAIFADARLGPVARAIVKLWYVGCWFSLPDPWQSRYGPSLRPYSFVPAPSAYAEGLLWRAIGAHPPGAKAPGFASWKQAPRIPSFADDPGPPPSPPVQPT